VITIHMTTSRRHESGLLRRAVTSVLDQTFGDFELVVCDDGSADGTAGYLTALAASDKRVRVIRNETNVNSVAISLGRCLDAADESRPWVTWMFDDCVLRPDALASLARRVEVDPTLEIVFGTTVVHKHRSPPLLVGHQPADVIRRNIERNATLVPNAGILVHRQLFDRVGWFDASVFLRRSCDWEWFRRAIDAGTPFAATGDLLCDEYGDQEHDSLRNTFTTDFNLMRKYAQLRDEGGWDLSLDSVLHHPVDRIPFGPWTPSEMRLCCFIALEYFLSIGDVTRATEWATRLRARMGRVPFYLDDLETAGLDDPATMGVYCGMVWGAYRTELLRGDPGSHRQRLAHWQGRVVSRLDETLAAAPGVHRAGQRAWLAVKPYVVRALNPGRP
jgi:glycosyltransferase involved in cell wall biosynthesis